MPAATAGIDLVPEIHAGPLQAVIYVTGGGMQASTLLVAVSLWNKLVWKPVHKMTWLLD